MQSPVCPVKPASCSVSNIEVWVELKGHAIVVDWRGVSMVWGLTGFLCWIGKCPSEQAR
jgi:hypothetical protein